MFCSGILLLKKIFYSLFDPPKIRRAKPPQPVFDEGSAKHSVHQFQNEGKNSHAISLSGHFVLKVY